MAQSLGSMMAGHNSLRVLDGVSQGQFLDWLDELRAEDEHVADAVAQRKEKLSVIKTAVGGKDEFAAFLRARRDADTSGHARETRDRAYRVMMHWQHKPVPAEEIVGQDDLLPIDLEQIDHEGIEAGRSGRRREANPYSPATEIAERWDAAWLRGQAELAETLAAGNGGEPREPGRRGRPPGSRDRNPRQRRSRTEMDRPDDRLH